MKFNLKNRPKVRSEDLPKELLATIALGMEDWFEGFEKELRELSKAYQLMDWLDKNHPEGKKWPSYGAKFISTLDKLIKEILGES